VPTATWLPLNWLQPPPLNSVYKHIDFQAWLTACINVVRFLVSRLEFSEPSPKTRGAFRDLGLVQSRLEIEKLLQPEVMQISVAFWPCLCTLLLPWQQVV